MGKIGGRVVIQTGNSTLTSSGDVLLRTANAGVAGVTGLISMTTGVATLGNAGSVTMQKNSNCLLHIFTSSFFTMTIAT